MKRSLFVLALITLPFLFYAQIRVMHAAAKAGLSIREKPAADAKVLEKIAYGEKVAVSYDPDTTYTITTEGLNGHWAKVAYKGKTGYIVNSYLFPSLPPKAGIKTLKAYLAQLAPVAGPALTTKKPINGFNAEAQEFAETLRKQFYKNGGSCMNLNRMNMVAALFFCPTSRLSRDFCYCGCWANLCRLSEQQMHSLQATRNGNCPMANAG